ncbi:hypothetical protein [Mycobacterium sp.]|uniref:hypothetical protein n=1 Tax=Mycobacterium sp. TaxID=1785 RepID=UPI002B741778|nr:hypothetical protein [Mycobacterium sp.]HTQ20960.1 hypothetical protein [Mycobacterium sp.]
MDQDDGEKRRFVARVMTAKHSTRLMLPFIVAGLALLAAVAMVTSKFPAAMESGVAPAIFAVLLLGLGIAPIPYLNRARKKELVISVTPDGLTVDRWPDDVFPFGDARLGQWTRRGASATTALHLQSGRHRFVVGRSELSARRVTPGLLPEAPPVGWAQPDAAMSGRDFDELVAVVVRRRELGQSP